MAEATSSQERVVMAGTKVMQLAMKVRKDVAGMVECKGRCRALDGATSNRKWAKLQHVAAGAI